MIAATWQPKLVASFPAKLSGSFKKGSFSSTNAVFDSSVICTKVFLKASVKCCRDKNERADCMLAGFSVLSSDVPWERGSIWSNMALYFFCLHIPLSFGGLSVVAYIMRQPVLDPQLEAISLLLIQTVELLGALVLLQYTAKPQFKLVSCFQGNKLSEERNWAQASALGFGILVLLLLLTSFLLDTVIGPKDVNNPILKEILSSSSLSKSACFLAYCVVTPLLEEIVYRGFLLASLASTVKWQQAVIISSVVFSAAHFSIDNSLQLFIIGGVLGCSYCWTGNLCSSVAIHSLYNAVTIMVMLNSFS